MASEPRQVGNQAAIRCITRVPSGVLAGASGARNTWRDVFNGRCTAKILGAGGNHPRPLRLFIARLMTGQDL